MDKERKHEKHYFRSDGNGGFNVSKSVTWLTLFALVITLLTSVITVTGYTVSNRNRIVSLEKDYSICQESLENNHNEVQEIGEAIAITSTKVENIEASVDELKSDFKSFIKEYKR